MKHGLNAHDRETQNNRQKDCLLGCRRIPATVLRACSLSNWDFWFSADFFSLPMNSFNPNSEKHLEADLPAQSTICALCSGLSLSLNYKIHKKDNCLFAFWKIDCNSLVNNKNAYFASIVNALAKQEIWTCFPVWVITLFNRIIVSAKRCTEMIYN